MCASLSPAFGAGSRNCRTMAISGMTHTASGLQGLSEVSKSVKTKIVSLPAHHHDFLMTLPLSFDCGDYFFVHAGVRPGVAFSDQNAEDLLLIREEFLLHQGDFGKIVVHGHTPVSEPEIHDNRINLDTGAFATGRLTCAGFEDNAVSFL